MKYLGAAVAAALLLVPIARSLEPGPWKINLTGTLVEERGLTRVYALYNKPAYQQRLGTGIITCTPLSRDFTDCVMGLRLGRGQILTRGMVPGQSSFRQLAVAGGTGLYSNTGGQLTIQPLGEKVVLILVDLLAYS